MNDVNIFLSSMSPTRSSQEEQKGVTFLLTTLFCNIELISQDERRSSQVGYCDEGHWPHRFPGAGMILMAHFRPGLLPL